jgi:hypothetical protein
MGIAARGRSHAALVHPDGGLFSFVSDLSSFE